MSNTPIKTAEEILNDYGTSDDYPAYHKDDVIAAMHQYHSQFEGRGEGVRESMVQIVHHGENKYWCKCESCGWENSSDYVNGGSPIGDTGDYSDVTCPVCGSNKLEGDSKYVTDEKYETAIVSIPLEEFLSPYEKQIERLNQIEADQYWSQVGEAGGFDNTDLFGNKIESTLPVAKGEEADEIIEYDGEENHASYKGPTFQEQAQAYADTILTASEDHAIGAKWAIQQAFLAGHDSAGGEIEELKMENEQLFKDERELLAQISSLRSKLQVAEKALNRINEITGHATLVGKKAIVEKIGELATEALQQIQEK